MSLVTVSAADFASAITAAKSVIASRAPSPVLGCVAISAGGGKMHVRATDLVHGIAVTVACEGSGDWLLNHDRLQSFASALPKSGVVKITGDGLNAALRCGAFSARISGYDPKDYPEFIDTPAFTDQPTFANGSFVKLLSRIAIACDQEGSYTGRGIHVAIAGKAGKLAVASSAIMASETFACDAPCQIDRIIDASSVAVASGLFGDAPIWVAESHGNIWMKSARAIYHSKCIDANPIDLSSLAPGDEPVAAIDATAFAKAIKAVQGMANDKTRAIYVSSSDLGNFIGAQNSDSVMCAPFESDNGAPLAIALNFEKTLKIIAACGAETIKFATADQCGIVKSRHMQIIAGNFFGIISPMMMGADEIARVTANFGGDQEQRLAA